MAEEFSLDATLMHLMSSDPGYYQRLQRLIYEYHLRQRLGLSVGGEAELRDPILHLLQTEPSESAEREGYSALVPLMRRRPRSNVRRNFDQTLVAWSMGLNPDEVRIPRPVPVSFYLEEDDPLLVYLLESHLSRFCETVGLEHWRTYASQRGSFFQHFLRGTQESMTRTEEDGHLELVAVVLRAAGEGKSKNEIEAAFLDAVKAKKHDADSKAAKIADSEARAKKSRLWAKTTEDWAKAAKAWAEAADAFIKTIFKVSIRFTILLGPLWLYGNGRDLVLEHLREPQKIFEAWQTPPKSATNATKPKDKKGTVKFCYVDKSGKSHESEHRLNDTPSSP